MPNRSTHLLIGAAVGITAYCVYQSYRRGEQPTVQFDVVEGLAWTTIGAAVACLPDILEPATSPNHRGTCHSWLMAAILSRSLIKLNSKSLTGLPIISLCL